MEQIIVLDMGLLNSPEAKAERKKEQSHIQERLRQRYKDGDTSLRKTIGGHIVRRARGGLVISSAEAVRYAYTNTPLPGHLGHVALAPELTPIDIEHIEAARSFLEEGRLDLVEIFMGAGYVSPEQLELSKKALRKLAEPQV